MSNPSPLQNVGGGQQQQQREQAPGWVSTIQKAVMFYIISQVAMKYLLPSKPPPAPAMPTEAVTYDQAAVEVVEGEVNPWLQNPERIAPLWPLQTKVTLHVYVSQSYGYDLFSETERNANGHLPSVVWDNITWGDWGYERKQDFMVDIPKAVQHNGSLFAHLFLTKDGEDITQINKDPQLMATIPHWSKPLTRFQPRMQERKQKNLLSSSKEEVNDEPEEVVITPYWHPDLSLALISDAAELPFANLAAPLMQHIRIAHGQRNPTGKTGFYYPVVFSNDFWILKTQMQEINTTTPQLPLTISFSPMSFLKFQIYASLTQGFDQAAAQQGGAAGAELDEVKRMLTETNPYFLGLTAIVSILHMLFEFLAFKNDVQHWRNKKEMVGVSVRTIITNVVVQGIILLYLMDNNENTSWMILLGQGTGMAIEAWKITKAVDISIQPGLPGSILPYRVRVQDKHVLSEDEKKTQEYDALAFRYVSYVAIPLLIGYSIYSLLYESHRGWYSFVISTLTSFVYMFGFAQLVPQLIINYKLKSVSHMPFKAMIYKTLSTVVDDFFAFCIKMPLMHRLACFRDDVVFLIFLYQRYIYRVDHKRLNEYGQVSDKAQDAKESKKNK